VDEVSHDDAYAVASVVKLNGCRSNVAGSSFITSTTTSAVVARG